VRHSHPPLSGIGLPIGAGAGVVGGLLAGGGPAVAIGFCIGAWLGVVVDAAVVARQR
jgi:hypothetical protein